MQDENEKLSLDKKQLKTLRSFNFYCRDRGLQIDEKFLEAAIKGAFLVPLLVDGSESFFSPHQIAIIARLRNNKIVDGLLRFPKPVAWEGSGPDQHEVRAIQWGYGYVVQREFERIFGWLEIFQNFLKLVHSLEPLPFHKIPDGKQGAFNDSPPLCFDFSLLDEKVLAEVDLNLEKLNALRKSIGFFAYEIDPMQAWYFYMMRHPRWKREELKGEARLSQELYFIDDLIRDLMEVIYGPQKDLPLLLNEGGRVGLLRDDDYVGGKDFLAIRGALHRLQQWCKTPEAAAFLEEKIIDAIERFKEKLKDFEKKFGTELKNEYSAKLTDLPPRYRTVNMHEQDGSAHVEDMDIELAVSFYLADLGRGFWSIADFFWRKVSDDLHLCFEEQNNWNRYEEPEARKKRIEKLKVKIKELQKIEDDLSEIMKSSRRALCSHCRENPVRQFDRGNQSEALLCEACLESFRKLALSTNEAHRKILKQRNQGRWFCQACGTLLYQFTNRNTFISEGQNGNMPVAKLKYGTIELEVCCKGNKKVGKCGHLNKRIHHFGWEK